MINFNDYKYELDFLNLIDATKKALLENQAGDGIVFSIDDSTFGFEQAKQIYPSKWEIVQQNIDRNNKKKAGFDYTSPANSSIPSGIYPLEKTDRDGLQIVQTAFQNGQQTTNFIWSNGVITPLQTGADFDAFVIAYVTYTNINLFGGTAA